MNERHIQAWKDADEYGIDNEEQLVRLIRVSLLTAEQAEWLDNHHKPEPEREFPTPLTGSTVLPPQRLTIEDLLNGRYAIDLEREVFDVFYKPWNDKLEANGCKRSFSEEPIGEALMKAIKDNLGGLDFMFQ